MFWGQNWGGEGGTAIEKKWHFDSKVIFRENCLFLLSKIILKGLFIFLQKFPKRFLLQTVFLGTNICPTKGYILKEIE